MIANLANHMLFRLLLVLTILGVPLPAGAATSGDILLLHGSDSPTRWTDSIAAGVAEQAGNEASLRQEYLGRSSMDEETVNSIAQGLKEQLPGSIRVVIATDKTASGFVSKYREELFPQATVILTGPDRIDPDRLALCDDCVALPLETDLDKTLDLIFALRPETRMVAGITDGSPSGLAARTALKQAMKQYEEKADLIFPGHEPGDDEGLDLDRLGHILAGMPGRSVAVLLAFHQDNAGNQVTDNQLCRLFSTHAAAPIFVLTDATLGSGTAGGMLVTGREAGRRAILVARRIQAGEPAQEMLPEPVQAKVVFDGMVLARFGMNPVDGATVINAPDPAAGSDGIVSGFVPATMAGLLTFAVLFFLLRRYRQNM